MADGRDIKYAQWGGRKPAYMNALEAAPQMAGQGDLRIMPVGNPQILPEQKAPAINPRLGPRIMPVQQPMPMRDPNVMPQGMNMPQRPRDPNINPGFSNIAAALAGQAVRDPNFMPTGMNMGSPGRRNFGVGSPGMRPRGDGRDRASSMAGLGAAYQQTGLRR